MPDPLDGEVEIRGTRTSRRSTLLSLFLCAILGVVGTTASYANSADDGDWNQVPAFIDDDVIHACVAKTNGKARIVAGPAYCWPGEHPLSWSRGPSDEPAPLPTGGADATLLLFTDGIEAS